MAGTYKATTKQVQLIFTLGRSLAMDDEDIHGLAYNIAHVESIRSMTRREAGRMIDILKDRAGQKPGGEATSPNRATQAQRGKIYALTREMGWSDQPERLRGYLRRVCGVEDVRFLTPQQAGKVIDGLKAMQAGGRAERKREVSG